MNLLFFYPLTYVRCSPPSLDVDHCLQEESPERK